MGSVFFISQFFVLIAAGLSNNTNGVYNLLKLIAMGSLPFTIFSAYYQWKIVKNGVCSACL
jgi:hypothetical protein